MKSAGVKHDGTKSRKSKKQSTLRPTPPSNGPGKMVTGAASKIRIFSLPSISPIATLEAATVGSSPKAGPSFLDAFVPLNDSTDMDQEEIQKEHYGERTPLQIPNQSRMATSTAEAVSKIGPIKLDENVEVIDLTSDSSVVDLTHNDSIAIMDESSQQQNQTLSRLLSNSCIVYNDDDSECSESDLLAASKLPRELEKERFGSSKPSGTVSCPICMDSYAEIVHSGRLIMSTKCGHIFCSQCLHNSLKSANSCPACRKKLNHKYHPIYI
ncbi:E3 ubiquitin-protein ligase RNF4-like [Candoia aspera]|uniref:E3 ubiquitin-protein ligase RNF4-like n=1 Tax=Candoia aspera TaxID=51853 RepID=UPI002FD7BD1A